MVKELVKELAKFCGLSYDPSSALVGSCKPAKRITAKIDSTVKRVNLTSTYVSENVAETDIDVGVVVHDVIKSASAEKIAPSLTERDLQEIQVEREKSGSKLTVEFCQEIKIEIAKGLSASQIEQIYKGKRGYSRNIKAVSAAIRRANNIV